MNAEKLENLCIVGGNINGAGTMVNSMEIPQKLKRLLWYNNCNSECIPNTSEITQR